MTVTGVNNTEALRNETPEVYQGSIPGGYLTVDSDVNPDAGKINDTAKISHTPSKPVVNSSLTQALDSPPPPPPPEGEESANYIKSGELPTEPTSTEDTSSTEETPPPPPPPGGDDDDMVGAGGDIDEDLDDVWNGLDEDNLVDEEDIEGSEDEKFEWVNEDALNDLYRALMGIMNRRLMLAMMLDEKDDLRRLYFQSISDTDYTDITASSTWSATVSKSNKNMSKYLQMGVASMMDKIQAHNDQVLADLEEEAKEAAGNGWDNFWSSNGDQQDALEMQKEARERYEAAVQKSVDAIKDIFGGAFQGLNNDIDKYGDAILDEAMDYGDHAVDDGNGYTDLNQTKDWIVALREELVGLLNLNRALVIEAKSRDELRKMYYQAIFEKGVSMNCRFEGVDDLVEAENARMTSLFDHTASEVLQIQKLDNEAEYIDRQIEKLEESRSATIAANFFKALAIVIAVVVLIVICVFTFGTATPALAAAIVALSIAAAVAGAISAGCGYGAAEIQNSVSDAYNPSVETMLDGDVVDHNKKHRSILDKSGELQQLENELLAMIGLGQVDTLSDGYKQVDNQALASLNRKLLGIQNMQRALIKTVTKRKSLARMYYGSSLSSADGLITGMADDSLRMGQVKFQAQASKLSEYTNAYNAEIQQERAMEAARLSFILSMVLAVVCAAVGGGFFSAAGAAIGFTVGQALGSSIAGVVSANKYGTDHTSYDTHAMEDVGSGKGLGASLDQTVFDAYNELLAHGTCDSGDGNIAIDTDAVKAALAKLQGAGMAMSNLVAAIEAKTNVRKSYYQALGVTVSDSESMKDMVRAIYESNMAVFRLCMSALNEQVTVHNRANEAQQQVDKAWTNFGVTLGLLALSAITGGAMSSFSAFQVGVTLTTMAQSVIEFAFDMSRAKDDMGNLERQAAPLDPEDIKHNGSRSNNQVGTDALDLTKQLDEMAASITLDSSMVEDIGGGMQGFNSGQMEVASSAMEAIARMRDIIADALQSKKDLLSAAARSIGVARPDSGSSLEMVNYIARNGAQQMIQLQMQAVQQLVDRHNQINDAKNAALLSGLNMGFKAISTSLAVANVSNEMTVEEHNDRAAAGLQDTPDEAVAYQNAIASRETIGALSLAFNALGTITDFTANLSLMVSAEENIESQPDTSDAEAKNKEIGQKQNALLSFGANADGMESDATASALNAGASNMSVQFDAFMQELDKAVNEASESMTKDTISTVKGALQMVDNSNAAVLGEGEAREAMEVAEEALRAQLGSLNLNQTQLTNLYQQLPAIIQESEGSPTVLAERLEQLIQQAMETQDVTLEVADDTTEKVSTLDQRTETQEQSLQQQAEGINFDLDAVPTAPEEVQGEEPQRITTEQIQRDNQQIEEQVREFSSSEEIEIDGEQAQLEMDSEQGPVIRYENGRTQTISQYVAEQVEKDRNFEFNEDDPVFSALKSKLESLDDTARLVQNLGDDVMNSESLAKAAIVSQQADALETAISSIQQDMRNRAPGGKELSEMTEEERQAYYEDIYNKDFVPTRDRLQTLLAERQGIQQQMRELDQQLQEGKITEADKNEKYQILQSQLTHNQAEEGALRAKIRAFNSHVGQINTVHRELTGHDLRPVEQTSTPIIAPETPVEVATESATGSAPAEGTQAAAGSEPVDTVEINRQAVLLDTADSVISASNNGSLMVDEMGHIIGLPEAEGKTVPGLIQDLQSELGQTDNEDQQKEIQKRIDKLTEIAQQITGTSGAETAPVTLTASAAAAESQMEDTDDTDTEEVAQAETGGSDGIDPKTKEWIEKICDMVDQTSSNAEGTADAIDRCELGLGAFAEQGAMTA